MSAYSFRQPVLRQIRGGVIANEFCEEHQTSPLRPWLDPKNWPQVLPNLGLSITIDRLVSDFQEAREKGAALMGLVAMSICPTEYAARELSEASGAPVLDALACQIALAEWWHRTGLPPSLLRSPRSAP